MGQWSHASPIVLETKMQIGKCWLCIQIFHATIFSLALRFKQKV